MKRFWSTPKYVARQRRLQKRHLERRRRRSLPTQYRRQRPVLARQRGEPTILKAPGTLNLFDYPRPTIAFCNDLRNLLTTPGTVVSLDLSAVTTFSVETLLVIRAIMSSSYRVRSAHVQGNLPNEPQVASDFKASGFFDGIAKPPADLPPARGIMRTESRDLVFPDIASELVDFAVANARLPSESTNACSQNLIELMTNTHNHAGNRSTTRSGRHRTPHRWSASVYCQRDTAYFSFVDLGKGILGTARHRSRWQKLDASLRTDGRRSVLTDIFRGALGSVTGKQGRGHGLPRLRRDALDGILGDVEILTSDVYGPIRGPRFRSAGAHLAGTLFRWRVQS